MDTKLIFTGLIFGSIGMGYVVYGRKQANMMALLAGVGLCVFPYFINSVWMSITIGVGLVLLPFVIRL
ncbi:MAG: hypothetical protein KKC76_18980 [Proteobacteria bacterium]|nr:hypothetical protein [Pseudomonadota bacterium]MBU4297497.1 hypothetical protein [Pseudomonadota bacterium]MCG2748649.1 hypothetical protein [Desulfobulbaceae bacterium]